MATKKYDIAVKVGEYQDRNGQTKGRYLNVGAVIQGDKGPYIVLERTFNPAGVPNPDNRSSLILSLFEPRDPNAQQGGGQSQRQDQPQQSQAARQDMDDDIPF